MLGITASELLSVDGAAAADRRKGGRPGGSPCCGSSCYPTKLKVEVGPL